MKRPRLVPERSFPAYAYVPGRFPHPVSDPAGHSHAVPPESPPPLDPARYAQSPTYLYGFDLFNHGYYWEAHEAWESLWHAAGRRGPVATLLKGLIKLAAAGVKIRQRQPAGARSHAVRAKELFMEVRRLLGQETPSLVGLCPETLRAYSDTAANIADASPPLDDAARVVFPFVIVPSTE